MRDDPRTVDLIRRLQGKQEAEANITRSPDWERKRQDEIDAEEAHRAENNRFAFALLTMGLLAVAAIWFLITRPPKDTSARTSPSSDTLLDEAPYKARPFVRRLLKAPSTAEFTEVNRVQRTADGEFLVVGHVEAKNSFGVPIKSKYVCFLRAVGDQWEEAGRGCQIQE
jgi:hypothetical protein